MPTSPHQRISSRSSSANIENSCWSESTWRIASHRSIRARSKFDTPIHRTFPASWSSAMAPHVSSIGTPVSSGQWS